MGSAKRLVNAFETDSDLVQLMQEAQAEARESLAVKSERRRAARLSWDGRQTATIDRR